MTQRGTAMRKISDLDFLLSNIDFSGAAAGSSCWEWTAHKNSKGYGRIGQGRAENRAHRLSYRLLVGKIPEGMCVLHKCDNPSCVRPEHLFLGDQAANVRDMVAKGRQLYGERVKNSKLTAEDVLGIRRMYAEGVGSRELGLLFGVSQANIGDIVRREMWKHVS